MDSFEQTLARLEAEFEESRRWSRIAFAIEYAAKRTMDLRERAERRARVVPDKPWLSADPARRWMVVVTMGDRCWHIDKAGRLSMDVSDQTVRRFTFEEASRERVRLREQLASVQRNIVLIAEARGWEVPPYATPAVAVRRLPDTPADETQPRWRWKPIDTGRTGLGR